MPYALCTLIRGIVCLPTEHDYSIEDAGRYNVFHGNGSQNCETSLMLKWV